LVGKVENGGEGAEFAVGHHVPDEPASQGQGVDGGVLQTITTGGNKGMVEEGKVEPHVVADNHRAPDELEEGREHGSDGGCVSHHCVADPGEGGDERRNAFIGFHQCLEGAQHLSTPIASRCHLGERRCGR
jgi:hypothetical protein